MGCSAGVRHQGQVGGSEAPGLPAPRSEQPGHSCSPPSGGLPRGSRLTTPGVPWSLGPSRGSTKPKEKTRVQELMPQSLRPMSSLIRQEGAEGISQASLGAPWADFPLALASKAVAALRSASTILLLSPRLPARKQGFGDPKAQATSPHDHSHLLHLACPGPLSLRWVVRPAWLLSNHSWGRGSRARSGGLGHAGFCCLSRSACDSAAVALNSTPGASVSKAGARVYRC